MTRNMTGTSTLRRWVKYITSVGKRYITSVGKKSRSFSVRSFARSFFSEFGHFLGHFRSVIFFGHFEFGHLLGHFFSSSVIFSVI